MINRVKVPMTGGVNLFVDPASIRDDQVVLAKNLAPVKPGIIGTRPALQWVRTAITGASGPYVPVAARFSPIGPEFALAWYNTFTRAIYFDLKNDNSSDPETSPVIGTGDSPIPVSMVQWDGDTYAFTGQTTGARAAFATNPEGYVVEAIAFEGTGNEDFKPKGAAVIRDRFVYWGFEDGAGGRAVLFADRGYPLRIGDAAVASARFIPVAGIAQSGITHCAELNTNAAGSPNQSVVAVWTVDNMWTLLGEPGETGDGETAEAIRGTLQQSLMTMNAGCVSGATVVQTPYGAIWTGPDDVWFMPFGSLPIRIGTNIRPALLNTPPNLKWKWHAAYDSDTAQYRLALFGPGSGPDEYSACDHHWILDLSKGAPRSADEAVWWGPQVYVQPSDDARFKGTHCLLTKVGNDGDRQTYGLVYVDGESFDRMSLCVLGADASRDCAYPSRVRVPFSQAAEYFVGDEIVPYDEDPGTTYPQVWVVAAVDGLGPNGGGVTAASIPQFNDGVSTVIVSGGVTFASNGPGINDFWPVSRQDGNEILPELITKEYTGDPMVDKLIDGAELGYWTNQMHRLSYRSLTDIDDNSRVVRSAGDETGVAGFLSSGLPNPGDMRGQRIWKTRLLTPTPGSRSTAKSVQMMITQDTVFVVDETNDVVVLQIGTESLVAVSVAHGEYTHDQLMTAIVQATDTALPEGYLEFSTQLIGAESVNHIRQSNGGNEVKIWFADTSALDSITKSQTDKCARLFSMLGFDTNAATFNAGVGVGYLSLPAGNPGAWVSARSSAETTRTARIQLSGLNLRVREFRRRPE